ncbi:MAG TPA: M20/M25/M40 family metallo-hydrolase [Gemmatimonadales bacterium]|nr:M20/M25/M40 family metallo-hydrolase [Gemmatimonadales bacterium]
MASLLRAGGAAWLALAAAVPLAAQQPAPAAPGAPPPAAAPAAVAERLDLSVLQRIRDEGLARSHVDSLAEYLTDVIGPRLTGSTGMRRADEWVTQVFRQWGLANVAVEPWDSAFGRGWERVSFSGRILEPFLEPLSAQPLAWSGSTRGTVTCPVVLLDVQDTSDLARYAGKLKGACVLRGAPRDIPPEFEPIVRRFSADSLLAPPAPPRPPQGPLANLTPEQRRERFAQMRAVAARINAWLRAQQPAVVLQPSNWTYGMLLVQGGPEAGPARDSAGYEPLPALLVQHEEYGTMYRNVKAGRTVRLEVSVQNRFLNDDLKSYNAFGEIPGTDQANQIVMVGGHLDSWHGGTGATDNGAGSVVMMEAMRILKTLNLPLRRTVRIGLWSGEEEGLLGSRAWVRRHAAELGRISAYLNVDNGTGRLRGIWDQMDSLAIPIFQQIFAPLQDLGVVVVRHGTTGGTDHLSFVAAGVPGFNYIQDPIEYGSRTHHSNVDTYERLQIGDLEQAATVVAWTVYVLANRDEMMPRGPVPAQRGFGF